MYAINIAAVVIAQLRSIIAFQNRPEGSTALNEHKQHYVPGPTKGDLIEDEASRVDERLPTGAPDQTLGRMSKTTGLAEATQDSMHR